MIETRQPINADVVQKLWGIQAKAKGSGNLGLSCALWGGRSHLSAYEIARPSCDVTHVVSIWTKGEVTSEVYLDGRFRYANVRRRGSFQLARAGESVRAVLSKRSGECLDLYLPVSLLKDCLEMEFDRFKPSLDLLPLKLVQDATIAGIGDVIAEELRSPDGASRVAIDSATLSLAVTLIRRYSNIGGEVRQPSTGLAEWQKRRAINRMNDALGSNLSLAEIAAEAGLSQFHFARAFKSSVGMAPHQYQIHLRMEKARTMLASSRLSITEIARSVGYGDVGYFSRLFQSRFGLSPKSYRDRHAL